MREIKFRAWWKPSLEEGNEYEGEMIQDFQIKSIIQNTTCTFHGRRTPGIEYFSQGRLIPGLGTLEHLTMEDIELMQFTGLLDKNGVEIYEGDILGCNGKPLRYVKYSNEFPGFDLISTQNGMRQFVPSWVMIHKSFDVIGNIYANPELVQP